MSRILTFFTIAYALSWAAWAALLGLHLSPVAGAGRALYIAAILAPHVSAVITAAVEGGSAGIRRFYGVFRWRGPLVWSLAAILVPPGVDLVRDVAYIALALPHDPFVHAPPHSFARLVFGQAVIVLGEEPGWRGFALPRLVARFGPIGGTLMLGVAWAAWHLPLFFMTGTPQYGTPFLPFVAMLTGWSMVMTPLVLRSGGSVIPALLFHASANIGDFTLWEPEAALPDLLPWAVAALVAALLLHVRVR